MRPTTLAISTALVLALGLLAGCDRKPQTGSAAGGSTAAPQSNTPSTPANLGQPNEAEKREGKNPVQGQVDPKQAEQHRDFQKR